MLHWGHLSEPRKITTDFDLIQTILTASILSVKILWCQHTGIAIRFQGTVLPNYRRYAQIMRRRCAHSRRRRSSFQLKANGMIGWMIGCRCPNESRPAPAPAEPRLQLIPKRVSTRIRLPSLPSSTRGFAQQSSPKANGLPSQQAAYTQTVCGGFLVIARA